MADAIPSPVTPAARTSSSAAAPAVAPAPSASSAAPVSPAPALPATPPAAPTGNRSLIRRVLVIGIPLAVLAAAVAAYLHGGRYISTDDAYVKANVLTVSTDVAGTVVEVGARENQLVPAGGLLYRLDDEPYRVALAAAEAQLATARDDIAVLRATYAQKLAEAQQAETDAAFYAKEYERISPLVKTNAATPSQADQAERNRAAARERVDGLRQEAAATLAQLGGNVDTAVDEHARVRQAAAQCDLARRNLAHTRVAAPSAGVVSHSDSLRPGVYLAAATPALALVESGEIWVEASPKETDLTHVRPGQPATVAVDAYPDRTWTGTVDTISPATGAQFALLPAQNASGNWVKVVQRIAVRIRLAPAAGAPELRAGMSVTARIDTGYRRTIGDLVAGIGAWFGLGG